MRDKVLTRLRRGERVSGEELGKGLGISRTAIWKYINDLRREGYRIESSPRKGYLLLSTPDIPFPEEIKSGLSTRNLGQQISFHEVVSSTQDIARSLAIQGAPEGTLVIAESQTDGKGRIGRTWTALPHGVQLSIILRPEIKPAEAIKLPLITGVAVAQAIRNTTHLEPKLKWPNDIMIRDKKVAGILTEMSAEVDRLDYVIIGIGLNVNAPRESFTPDMELIGTSLLAEQSKSVPRVKIIQALLTEMETLYDDFQETGFDSIRYKWKALSNTIGVPVIVGSATERITGTALDIDSDGALVLQKENGDIERIIAGDISLRKVPGG